MRTEFVECKYKYQAVRECPWAARFAKVVGGYMAFESVYDYKVWLNQK